MPYNNIPTGFIFWNDHNWTLIALLVRDDTIIKIQLTKPQTQKGECNEIKAPIGETSIAVIEAT